MANNKEEELLKEIIFGKFALGYLEKSKSICKASSVIDSKITMPVAPDKREVLKTELGKAVSILNKPESFLMVGFEDNYDLYMGGEKLEKGAYVAVSLFGNGLQNVE